MGLIEGSKVQVPVKTVKKNLFLYNFFPFNKKINFATNNYRSINLTFSSQICDFLSTFCSFWDRPNPGWFCNFDFKSKLLKIELGNIQWISNHQKEYFFLYLLDSFFSKSRHIVMFNFAIEVAYPPYLPYTTMLKFCKTPHFTSTFSQKQTRKPYPKFLSWI